MAAIRWYHEIIGIDFLETLKVINNTPGCLRFKMTIYVSRYQGSDFI
jgi:hypothetical protein